MGAIAGAGLVTVDPGIASRATEERRWAARALRGGGLPRIAGPRAVVGHDLVTARRSPGQFLVAAAVRHELPPIVTPMGALPTGPLNWAATGWAIAVLGTLPALIALVTGAPTAMILPQAIVSLVGLVAFVLVAGRGDGGR